MKVRYTDEAFRDLDEILTFIGSNYPAILAPLEIRLRAIERRVGEWPESAAEVERRPGVHLVPFAIRNIATIDR